MVPMTKMDARSEDCPRGGHHAAHHARLARRRSTARLPWDFYRFKMARLGCYCTGGRLSNEGRIGRANERARVSSPVPSRACVVARTCRRARRSALDNREAVFSKGQGIFHVASEGEVPSELLFVVYFVEREPRHSATREDDEALKHSVDMSLPGIGEDFSLLDTIIAELPELFYAEILPKLDLKTRSTWRR